jgi:hypothetical protein
MRIDPACVELYRKVLIETREMHRLDKACNERSGIDDASTFEDRSRLATVRQRVKDMRKVLDEMESWL